MKSFENRELLPVVIAGHVDHGKSTIVGRLLADTHSLPEGKLEQVKESCKANSRPFEYAFLLDALKDEQSQGITIDSARCFFKTEKRNYLLIDAPGHIEFLKNMVTGAARAEAALIVIDAQEGICENSRRHGYLISMLGIKQVAIAVNKFDLVNCKQEVFENIKTEYSSFLSELGLHNCEFIPLSGREGINISEKSSETPWYNGKTLLETLESFPKPKAETELPFRMPVHDIYKFTAGGDDRRIIAGTIESGIISEGDRISFFPSGKKTRIKTIERFNCKHNPQATPGEAPGFTMVDQIYIRPGEVMVRDDQTPTQVGSLLKVRIFWLAQDDLQSGEEYSFKLGTNQVNGTVVSVDKAMDASDFSTREKTELVHRHEIAELTIQTFSPIAFDPAGTIDSLSRFVIVHNLEISGGGIILNAIENDEEITPIQKQNELEIELSPISTALREKAQNSKGNIVLVTGSNSADTFSFATQIESTLFEKNPFVYLLAEKQNDTNETFVRHIEKRRQQEMEQIIQASKLLIHMGQLTLLSIHQISEEELSLFKSSFSSTQLNVVAIQNKRLKDQHIDLSIDEIENNSVQQTVDWILTK